MLCLKTWLYPVWKLVYTMYEDITNLYSNFFGDLSALYFKVFLHNEWRHVYTKTASWWHFYKIDQIGHVEENGQWVKIQNNLVQKASNLTMIFQGFKTIESLFIRFLMFLSLKFQNISFISLTFSTSSFFKS